MYFEKSVFPHHKLDGVEEALVELRVLEVILWTICAIKHATRITRRGTELLLPGVLFRKRGSFSLPGINPLLFPLTYNHSDSQ